VIAGMLIGAGLVIVGVLVGHAQGYLMGVKVRNVSSLTLTEPETRDCVCGHAITGHVLLRRRKVGDTRGSCQTAIGRGSCACAGYVPRPAKVPTPPRGLLDL
jgi:hypothetical protein